MGRAWGNIQIQGKGVIRLKGVFVDKKNVREIVIEGRDKDRMVQLHETIDKLEEAFKMNMEMQGFILRAYVKKGEKILSFDDKTGTITVQKTVEEKK